MTTLERRLTRCVLASVWLVTGVVVLCLYPKTDSLALLARVGLHERVAQWLLTASALLDVLLGLLTLCVHRRWLWRAQAALIVGYTLIITLCLPEFWLHPFGPIVKNLPILLILWSLDRDVAPAQPVS